VALVGMEGAGLESGEGWARVSVVARVRSKRAARAEEANAVNPRAPRVHLPIIMALVKAGFAMLDVRWDIVLRGIACGGWCSSLWRR